MRMLLSPARIPAAVTALLLALTALLVGCGSDTNATDDSSDQAEALDLSGDWLLTSGTTADGPMSLDDTHPATLAVDGTAVSGQSACNRFMGEVTVDGDSVSFGMLGGTQMACIPASVMELEQVYLAALGTIESGSRDGDTLTLTGPDTSLAFEPVPPVPTAELAGTTWTLESVITGDSVSSVMGEPATLLLAEDGAASGSTGCRVVRGSWKVEDDQLVVPDLATTKNACPEDVDAQDQLVVAVLTGPATVAIDGTSLTLTIADGSGLGYRAQ